MNCDQIEVLLRDSARDRWEDEIKGRSALLHIQSCRRCADRLEDERALTAGLRALAATTENQQAPPEVEAALRMAFRKRARTSMAPGLVRPAGSGWRIAYWIASMAAVILVAILLAVTQLRSGRPPAGPGPSAGGERPPENVGPVGPELVARPTELSPEIRPGMVHRPVPLPAGKRVERSGTIGRPGGHPRPTLEDAEIATDFFPMTYGSLSPLEAGRFVRVQVPRSMLASYGLPMNADRAHEPISADVLVGNDGLARAIRFVRQPPR